MWKGTVLSGVVAACALATGAHAGPGLVVGLDDDSLKWTGNTAQVVDAQQALGVHTVRVTLHWAVHASQVDPLGQLYLRRVGRAIELGDRVILSVYGSASRPPLTERMRTEYCSYVVDALERVPGVRDVVIWNEANSSDFWRPQRGAAAAYELLLARCYDMVDAYRPTMNVISSTAPHDDPAAFIRDLGAAYRASGRRLPIFDTFGHDAYPETDAEPPFALHAGASASIDEGDYGRLVGALASAFGGTVQPVPGHGSVRIWYLEDGFQTRVPASKLGAYTGRQLDPAALAALSFGRQKASVVPDQATQLNDAVKLAYCQPAVGAFFNFQLTDDHNLGGWQSGLLWANWTQKPSWDLFRATVADIKAGTVDCKRFPAAAVRGP